MMYYMYDTLGRYIGHTQHDIESFSEYSYVEVEPPAHDVHAENIFKPINWPYWTGTAWQLIPQD